MFLDVNEQLSSAQAVTDTDAYSENVKDLGNVDPERELGGGEPMVLAFVVDVAAAGSTDTTDLMAVCSANENLSSHKECASRRIANARLTAGSIHYVPVPPGSVVERFFGGRTELGSGDTITVSIYLIPQKLAQVQDPYYSTGIVVD
jgi:hypothetical protein